MKCVICHGENIKFMKVKEEFTLGSDVVYIPVKVSVCQTCGERYYDRRTMQLLEEICVYIVFILFTYNAKAQRRL